MGLGINITKLYDELTEVSKKQSEHKVIQHYHHCPECYEVYPCLMDCTIEYDLEEDGKQFGAHCECFQCKPIPGYDSVGNKIEEYSKEWWDIYHGFKRR